MAGRWLRPTPLQHSWPRTTPPRSTGTAATRRCSTCTTTMPSRLTASPARRGGNRRRTALATGGTNGAVSQSRAGQGKAWQGRAGQGKAGQGRADSLRSRGAGAGRSAAGRDHMTGSSFRASPLVWVGHALSTFARLFNPERTSSCAACQNVLYSAVCQNNLNYASCQNILPLVARRMSFTCPSAPC